MGPGRGPIAAFDQGDIVLVPFPFTDLTGAKRRPALVVSPRRFHPDDLVVCAITSQATRRLSRWEVALTATDLVRPGLPKPSVIRVGKLFTTHRGLVVGRFSRVQQDKLDEVLDKLQALFRKPGRPH